MKTSHLSLISLFVWWMMVQAASLQAQCRSESDWQSAWTSCQMAPSPNAMRGNGHWLLYDFGYAYPIEGLHIWNANQASLLNRGAKSILIDYSLDGRNWQELGQFSVEKASGASYYSGMEVGRFAPVQAQYILLTVTETWGDPCASMHEVSFSLAKHPVPATATNWVYPNPARGSTTVAIQSMERSAISIRLLSVLGQIIRTEHHRLNVGRNDVKISLQGLAPGLYILQSLNEDGEIEESTKLIVQ
ncbi:MAG: discoidin domain-containing protein [Bacteroidota bacterium]